jgi:Fe-S-cluster-containing dehydrogenase component/DMSO reductase anchor subunit
LIPLSAPKPGEQYAFEVALDSCTGCKACVSACHSLNGLDDTESWRDVGLVVDNHERHPFQQTVTTACHHCTDPGCLNGCPVLAYEKDPATGIVRHLDDQCIGCQYCILKCPYDVPKYNARLGIVRKCDLCQSRLSVGEAPACAQACPTHAIRIITVSVPSEPTRFDPAEFLKAAPDPAYTRPTTRYVSRRTQPKSLRAADSAMLRPQPPHWPLAWMLTLMPLAVGCHVLASLMLWREMPALPWAWALASAWWHSAALPSGSYAAILLGGIAGLAGLGASVAHLGQPLRAWRIFLGWRRSWLSREAMAFGGWLPLALTSVFVPAAVLAAAIAGVVGLACSVMIYADTHRRFWRVLLTGPRFFGSALVFGVAIGFALDPGAFSAAWLTAAVLVKLATEWGALNTPDYDDDDDPAPSAEQKTARLVRGRFRTLFGLRSSTALLAGTLAPWLVVAQMIPPVASLSLVLVLFFGELVDRHLFFRVVDAPKMPGLPA